MVERRVLVLVLRASEVSRSARVENELKQAKAGNEQTVITMNLSNDITMVSVCTIPSYKMGIRIYILNKNASLNEHFRLLTNDIHNRSAYTGARPGIPLVGLPRPFGTFLSSSALAFALICSTDTSANTELPAELAEPVLEFLLTMPFGT